MAVKKQTKKKMEVEVAPIVTVVRASLLRALNMADKAVSPKPPTPLLSNVLIEFNGDNSSVVATNLEIGIRSTFSSSGLQFRTCIPCKTFQSFVDTISSQEIYISHNDIDQSVVVNTESSTSSIKCVSADEFPPVPSIETPTISIPVEQFKQMVNRVAFSSGDDETRPVLTGVLLAIEGEEDDKKFVMFAADGQRASYEETGMAIIEGDIGSSAIIKGTTLELISRILPDEGMVDIEFWDTKALFHCEDVDIITQLIGGNFPSHEAVLNSVKERSTNITVDTMEILRACKQLKVFTVGSGATMMDIQEMMLVYSTVKHETGSSDITMFIEKTGEDLVVGINTFYLYEFLEVVKTPFVNITFNGSKKPILLRMQENEEYFHIIMPVAIPGKG